MPWRLLAVTRSPSYFAKPLKSHKTKQGMRMNRLCKTLMVLQVAAGLSGLAIQARAAEPAKPDVNRGQAIAMQVCASCHGGGRQQCRRRVSEAGGPAPRVSRQAAQGFQDAAGRQSSPRATMRSWRAWPRRLSDQDMVNVAAYFAAQTPSPAMRITRTPSRSARRFIAAGSRTRACRRAQACHGADRAGDSVAVSASVGAVGGIHGGAVDRVHARSGRAQQQRARCTRSALRLSDSEIKAVADYIAGLH